MFYKKDVLKNFTIFERKHLCWSLFLTKLLAFRAASLLEWEIRCFLVDIPKVLRTPILKNTNQRLLPKFASNISCIYCHWLLNSLTTFLPLPRFSIFCVLCLKYQKQPPELFCKKRFLRHFAKFTRKHLCQSLFFNKVAGTGVFLWILRNFQEHLF